MDREVTNEVDREVTNEVANEVDREVANEVELGKVERDVSEGNKRDDTYACLQLCRRRWDKCHNAYLTSVAFILKVE